MKKREFDLALNNLLNEGFLDAITFLVKVCHVEINMAKLLIHSNKDKEDFAIRVYNSLPKHSKDKLRKFDKFELKVEIKFNYE